MSDIRTGDPETVARWSAFLTAEFTKNCKLLKYMSRAAMSGKDYKRKMAKYALAKKMGRKYDSSKEWNAKAAPMCEVTELQGKKGDKVKITLAHFLTGKASIGDERLEGRLEKQTYSTDEIRIDQIRHGALGGGKMSNQRVAFDLRSTKKPVLAQYGVRRFEQDMLFHLGGARGTNNSEDYHLPLESEDDFDKQVINPLRPPTNGLRSFFPGAITDVENLTTMDTLGVATLDKVRATLEDQTIKMVPAQLMNADESQESEPMYILFVTWQQYFDLKRSNDKSKTVAADGSTGPTLREMVTQASARYTNIGAHPLFTGDVLYWENIVIKPIDFSIKFTANSSIKYTNPDDGSTISKTAPHEVHRALLVGGEAISYASVMSGGMPLEWVEEKVDMGNDVAFAFSQMYGFQKPRFRATTGKLIDHGVTVIDTTVSASA